MANKIKKMTSSQPYADTGGLEASHLDTGHIDTGHLDTGHFVATHSEDLMFGQLVRICSSQPGLTCTEIVHEK